MRKFAKAGVVAMAATAAVTILPAASAEAASRGTLKVCLRDDIGTGFGLQVSADGPSSRSAFSLIGDDCVSWRVRVGSYKVQFAVFNDGFFGQPTPTEEFTCDSLIVRQRRGGAEIWKGYDFDGTIQTYVRKNRKTHIEFFCNP